MPFSADGEYVQQRGEKSRDNPKGQTAAVQKVDVTNWIRWWEIKETWSEKHELQSCGCRICFCQEVFCPPTRAGGRRYTGRQACAPECANFEEKRCACNSFLSPTVADGVFLYVSSASQTGLKGGERTRGSSAGQWSHWDVECCSTAVTR